jgi:hypothetical protein
MQPRAEVPADAAGAKDQDPHLPFSERVVNRCAHVTTPICQGTNSFCP